MNKKYIDTSLKIIGLFFIIVGLIAYNEGIKGSGDLFWYTYTAIFLIGLGIILKKTWLIGSQINIVAIPYLFWNIDLFSRLITNKGIFGIVNYLFTPRSFMAQVISMQHIFLVPIAIVAFYYLKPKKYDFWKLSIAQITLFYFLTRWIYPESNVNCVISSCVPFTLGFLPYPLAWFISSALMILITNLILAKAKRFINEKFL